MEETLEQFVTSVKGTSHLRVEHDYGDGFVRLMTSEAERRQAAQDIRSTEDIVLELLRNSRDAFAKHIFVAFSREANKRLLTVIDDGCGIPETMHRHVFEPRVTSKLDSVHMDAWGVHGRGMALFSIAENADEARVVVSKQDLGCSIRVQTDLARLREKADQSSFPTFELAEEGKVNVRGPKNVLRTVCEFAIESRSNCDVYIGSPTEIASTMHSYGSSTLSVVDRLFPHNPSGLPLVKRLAVAGTPYELSETAGMLGLDISERTARRILDDELPVLDSVLEQISITNMRSETPSRKPASKGLHATKLRLQKSDADQLSSDVKEAFRRIASSYYLEPDVVPVVKVRSNDITVTIPAIRLP